jgi:hypothetical protein
MLVKTVLEKDVREVRHPAGAQLKVRRTTTELALAPGPLYVIGTSVGPRGHSYPAKGVNGYLGPGYAHLELVNDGTIHRVDFRFPKDQHTQDRRTGEAVAEAENIVPKAGSIGPGVGRNNLGGALHHAAFGWGAAKQSSLEPGQSIVVDKQNVRTYVDAIAWYTTRRDILLEQKQAFVKDRYLVPNGLDDLGIAADARVKMMRKLGSQPVSDNHVVGMLDWFEAYLKVMYECDLKMEGIAADRFRATQAEIEKLKEWAARLEPQLRDFQRSAFRSGNKSKLKESAETFATWLDSALTAEQWLRDAFTKFDDIRALGTTLRAQKALHGSSQPWHELMRQTTNTKISKLLSVADGLNKAVAAWQL